MNLMVVDDQQINLKYVHRILINVYPELTIYLHESPQKAMEHLEKEAVDVLLLDIMMPEISGTDILRYVRTRHDWDSMQVIMITAVDDEEVFEECYELGANDYIKKPVTQAELVSRVGNAMKMIESQRKLRSLLDSIKGHNTELREMYQQLHTAHKQLIQSEKLAAIGQLAAGVAHEINNPIGYVSSNLETMTKYVERIQRFLDTCQDVSRSEHLVPLEEAYHQQKMAIIMEDIGPLVTETREGVARVAEIVTTLRNFAYSNEDDDKSWVSLNNVVRQTMMMLHNESKYVADVVFDEREEVQAWCHKGQMNQVVMNVLFNAIQAVTPQAETKRGMICIGLQKVGDEARITIEDNGPGVDPAHIDRLFEPFFTTKDVGQGTGLGLSISYDIITKKHQGSLTMENLAEGGVRFHLNIPVSGMPEDQQQDGGDRP